ncbi:DNA polymerase [Verrucomicrobia bacterium]|nr:DNA polymerase [Verrucomicrobiota bacterium]
MKKLSQFEEIWVVDFEYRCPDGDLPTTHCMVAREIRSRRVIRFFKEELSEMRSAPFDTTDRSLFVAYYAPAEFGCFLELGWDFPTNTLDLYAEFRRLICGNPHAVEWSLVAALDHFNLAQHTPTEKDEWRGVAIRGGPFSESERKGLLDYCQKDVEAASLILNKILKSIHIPHALIRGRYMQSVARMERNGIPIDMTIFKKLKDNWDTIKMGLIAKTDIHGIYIDGAFSKKRFAKLLADKKIAWPRLPVPDKGLKLTDEVFRGKARIHPEIIAPYYELRSSLSRLKLAKLCVGSDGRNRTMLSPFRSDTGRNQPSNSRFIFGPSTWIRGLIKPPPGRFIAYIDWSQQELGIAAALSGDVKMMEAYNSGDPYLKFAQMAGAVPENATKQTHPQERAAYKVCMLAVQYGMGPEALAGLLSKTRHDANRLHQSHRDTFPEYWRWNERILDHGLGNGQLETVFGWRRLVNEDSKPASAGNFPVQANGAEMLRLAITRMHEEGVKVAAPIHDAVLVEGQIEHTQNIVATTQRCMRYASRIVLNGFELDSDVKVVTYPGRYMDEDRGADFWNNVMTLIGSKESRYRS